MLYFAVTNPPMPYSQEISIMVSFPRTVDRTFHSGTQESLQDRSGGRRLLYDDGTLQWAVIISFLLLLFSGHVTAADLPATLLLEAYNPDGSRMSVSDFVNYTHYVSSSKWSSYQNYGVFPIGTMPATAQIGSDFASVTRDAVTYIAFSVPANRAVYFTALWKAPNIGTIFMRADNSGSGYTVASNQNQILQLAYEFAGSEYNVAYQIFSSYVAAGHTRSADASNALSQASAALQSAKDAGSGATRAIASYNALAIAMPLKERLVLEMSDAGIQKSGYICRADHALSSASDGDRRISPGSGLSQGALRPTVNSDGEG
jgi:hypothetical protein